MSDSNRVRLASQPPAVDDENREALARANARRHRDLAIFRAENRCQKCDWFAWSYARRDQLDLRPKAAVAGKPSTGEWVLCPTCTAKHDAKQQHRSAS